MSDKQQTKTVVSWEECTRRAKNIAEDIRFDMEDRHTRPVYLYGVPRGGIFATQLVLTELASLSLESAMCNNANDADYVIDDIVDTGKTALKYVQGLTKHRPFYSLYNKTDGSDDAKMGWIVFPWEAMQEETAPTENVRRLIEYIGDDPNREGLLETPNRVIRSYEKLFGGYKQNPEDIGTVFLDHAYDQIVVLKSIEMVSSCEHHMLPFYGQAHIAYLPDKKLLGISKLARILEIYARRLQIQERLTNEVADAVMKIAEPKGAACVIEAQHLCMVARGVEKQHSIMVTSCMRGCFQESDKTRAEFLRLIGK